MCASPDLNLTYLLYRNLKLDVDYQDYSERDNHEWTKV